MSLIIYKYIYLILIINLVFKQSICQSLQDQEPHGIHLVYGSNSSTEINIFWWTKVQTTSAIVFYSLVEIEKELLHLDTNVCNHNLTAKGYLARNQTNGKYIQRVLLKNLVPDRLYCYEIKSGDTTSDIYSFRTGATSINYHSKSYKAQFSSSNFIVYGGETEIDNPIKNLILPQNFQENIFNQFKSINLYSFINMGDIYLKEYSLNNANDERDFFESAVDVFAHLPILPTFGSFYDLTNLKLFRSMFTFMNEWPLKSFWYSFDVNGIHFISYSTDLFLINESNNKTNITVDVSQIVENQLNWLKNDLNKANNNRDSVPWIVVLARQPMYCVVNCPLNCNTKADTQKCVYKDEIIRKKLESILYHYGVDLVLESSQTVYTRTYPLIKDGNFYETSYTNVDMPVHIAIPRTINTDNNANLKEDKWIAFKYNSESNFNYGQITVFNVSHLKWSYMRPNQTVIDSVYIVKTYHGFLNADSYLEKKLISDENSRLLKQRSIKIILFTSVFFVIASILVFYGIMKRNQRLKAQQHASQYANLIESELEA